MRIPGRKIWRAFRELDEFPDERCRRFVRRVSPWGWSQAIRAVIGVVVTTALMLGMIFGLFRLTEAWDKRLGSGWEWAAVLVPIWIAGLTLCVFPVLVARDALLRRRIRTLLDSRASCAACGYMLLGLPVAKDLFVACPECGATTRVDEALGELAMDEAGRARFSPQRGAIDDATFFWTTARRRFVLRAAWRTVTTAALAACIALATYELSLLVQAVAARTDVDWTARLAQMYSQPKGEQTIWSEIDEAVQRYEQLEQQAAAEVAGERASSLIRYRVPMFFREKVRRLPPDAGGFLIEEQAAEIQAIEISRRTIRTACNERIFSRLDACDWGKAAPMLTMPVGGSPFDMTFDDGWMKLVRLSEIVRARMASALDCGDVSEFEAAFVLNERLVNAFGRVPAMMAFYRASSTGDAALQFCADELAGPARTEFVVAIDRLLGGMRPEVSPESVLDAEHMWKMACLQWVFSNPDRVRWGRQSKTIRKIYQSDSNSSDWTVPGRLGWYWENRAAFKKMYPKEIERLGAEQWEQPPGGKEESELFFANIWPGDHAMLAEWGDRSLLRRRTIAVMLALERFRLRNGDYPAALAEIENALDPNDLRDPYSGKSFCYQKLDDLVRASCTGAKNRVRILGEKPYLLYTVGWDGADDFCSTNSLDVFYPPLGNTKGGSGIAIDLLLNATGAEWERATQP